MPKKIIAYGNPVYDLIVTPEVRTPGRVLSGCSTNACLAAAKLGERTTLIGCVGADFHDRLKADLERYGVEARLLPSGQTGGFSLEYYDDQGNRHLEVLGIADPIQENTASLDGADFVLLGPILGEVDATLAQSVRARTTAPILLDPQGLLRRIAGANKIEHYLSEAYRQTAPHMTVVKANEVETHTITGLWPREQPEAAVRALHQAGGQIAVATLADAGSVIYDGRSLYTIPAYAVRAIDPTGAGDTYAAGFMIKYRETPDDLLAVGCFASAVASQMVEQIGPDFVMSRAETERRAAELLPRARRVVL